MGNHWSKNDETRSTSSSDDTTVCTDAGIHLLYYAGDLPAGDHVLTEDEQESLNAAALYAAQSRELEKLFAEWMNDYEIETHPELLGQ